MVAENQQTTRPLRYIRVLENLGKYDIIISFQADRGGGVLIMNKVDYNIKTINLLSEAQHTQKGIQALPKVKL